MMGFIAFVMLVAAGYAQVLRETHSVESLVNATTAVINTKLSGAIVMLLVGLLITMGIGTSFGTIPVVASIYIPMGYKLGFSTGSIILLIGIAAALGDAGSPASDSTLGPTQPYLGHLCTYLYLLRYYPADWRRHWRHDSRVRLYLAGCPFPAKRQPIPLEILSFVMLDPYIP